MRETFAALRNENFPLSSFHPSFHSSSISFPHATLEGGGKSFSRWGDNSRARAASGQSAKRRRKNVKRKTGNRERTGNLISRIAFALNLYFPPFPLSWPRFDKRERVGKEGGKKGESDKDSFPSLSLSLHPLLSYYLTSSTAPIVSPIVRANTFAFARFSRRIIGKFLRGGGTIILRQLEERESDFYNAKEESLKRGFSDGSSLRRSFSFFSSSFSPRQLDLLAICYFRFKLFL